MQGFFLKGVTLNENEALTLRAVQELCRKEIAPMAADVDEKERFPWEAIHKINDMGFNSLFIPEAYGGTPISKLAWLTIVKEISKACSSTGLIVATTAHCCYPIVLFGTDEQKKKFLPIFLKGAVGAFSLTESDAGSDAKSMKSVALKTSDGYILNGTKSFVTSGDVAEILTMFVKVKEKNEILGISPFVLTKDMTGLIVGKIQKKMGLRASQTADITIEDCYVPADHLLGSPRDGLGILLRCLNESRPNIAAQAIGTAEAAFEAAVSYANQRIQFGKQLIQHQGIQFMIAEMATDIQAAWQVLLHVARLIDQGQEDFATEASMAKLLAGEMSERVTSNAIQIHGGYGYCRDYPVERLYRDSRITQIYEGTNQIQKIVIGRHFSEKIKDML